MTCLTLQNYFSHSEILITVICSFILSFPFLDGQVVYETIAAISWESASYVCHCLGLKLNQNLTVNSVRPFIDGHDKIDVSFIRDVLIYELIFFRCA